MSNYLFREERGGKDEGVTKQKHACDIKEGNIEEQQSTVDLPRLSAGGAER